MNTVEVTGPGQITGTQQNGPYTYNQWTFPVVVNGQAGVASVWALPGVSDQDIVNYLIEQLEQGDIGLGGISEYDPGTDTDGDDSRVADGVDDNRDDGRDDGTQDDGDDDDGGALAGGGDGWGDSA